MHHDLAKLLCPPRKVCNRGATHLLAVLLLLLSASISATNAMMLAASGFVVLA